MEAATIERTATEADDLSSTRCALSRLVWGRQSWSLDDAERYRQLCDREAQFLSVGLID